MSVELTTSLTVNTKLLQDKNAKAQAAAKIYIYRNVLLACLGSILLGYDVGIMSGVLLYMESDLDLTDSEIETIIASLNFASAIGGLISGPFAQKFGRRATIAAAAIIFFTGALLMAATRIFFVLVIARVILGIGVGAGLMVAPLYIAEISPPDIRGRLLTFDEIAINMGIFIGYIAAWLFYFSPYDDSMKWRIGVGLGVIPALALFIGAIFIPESPRWLIQNGREKEAKHILNRIYGQNEQRVNKEMEEIRQILILEKNTKKIGWNVILCSCIFAKERYLTMALFIGVGLCFFQQASGNEAAVYYTPQIFTEIGMTRERVLLMTTFVGLAKAGFTLVSTLYLDKVGRKKILLISAILMTMCLFGLGISFMPNVWPNDERPVALAVFLQISFMASFSIGWGPICWIVAAEVLPLKIRARGIALAVFLNRIASSIIAFTFLTTQNAITPQGTFFLYGSISFISVVFIMVFVPETKGKTLELITKEMIETHNVNTAPDGNPTKAILGFS